MSTGAHEIRFYDSEQLFWDFQRDIAVRLARLETAGMMPEAVLIRDDLFPGIVNWQGYPVVRLMPSQIVMWGVLA